jgi:hypothetical protein
VSIVLDQVGLTALVQCQDLGPYEHQSCPQVTASGLHNTNSKARQKITKQIMSVGTSLMPSRRSTGAFCVVGKHMHMLGVSC